MVKLCRVRVPDDVIYLDKFILYIGEANIMYSVYKEDIYHVLMNVHLLQLKGVLYMVTSIYINIASQGLGLVNTHNCTTHSWNNCIIFT